MTQHPKDRISVSTGSNEGPFSSVLLATLLLIPLLLFASANLLRAGQKQSRLPSSAPLKAVGLASPLKGVSEPGADLPVMGEVPPFTLTTQENKPLSRDDLKGSIWIADFIFTRCPGPCAAMSRTMASIGRNLEKQGDKGQVQLISISVDPGYDTPDVLRRYAEGYDADGRTWRFLTGDRKAIYDLSTLGFKLSAAQNDEGIITHSSRLALIDQNAKIRGYYDGEESASVERLRVDLQRLLGHR